MEKFPYPTAARTVLLTLSVAMTQVLPAQQIDDDENGLSDALEAAHGGTLVPGEDQEWRSLHKSPRGSMRHGPGEQRVLPLHPRGSSRRSRRDHERLADSRGHPLPHSRLHRHADMADGRHGNNRYRIRCHPDPGNVRDHHHRRRGSLQMERPHRRSIPSETIRRQRLTGRKHQRQTFPIENFPERSG